MGKKFAEMQADRDMRVQEAAKATYEQFMADMLSIVLNDPNVMGKDTFGWRRIEKVLIGIRERQDEFMPALDSRHPESDYCRKRMDENLSSIFPPEKFCPYDKRYDYVRALVPLGEERKNDKKRT